MTPSTAAKNDFSKGEVWKNIVTLAIPMTVAQMVQILYNVVDRVYIGHLPGASSLALTGLGLTFPLITIISAFTNLFGMGGAPLFSIARGRGDEEEAGYLLGNTCTLLVGSSVFLTVLFYLTMEPLLFLFGASEETYVYAASYMRIYLVGTLFSMFATGMNGFINSQGFGRIGMMTNLIGCILNLIIDPLFIFVFHMGIRGAALATIISQTVAAAWVFRFLTGKTTLYRINKTCMRLKAARVKQIVSLGLAGFIMAATNGAVQIACNKTLSMEGGDLYVGIMTVLNSIRDMVHMPCSGVTGAAQPILGFNYGAGEYKRVKQGIRFITVFTVLYMLVMWGVVMAFPQAFIRIFNSDPAMLSEGSRVIKIYFFGFFMMAFQAAGQSAFTGLGQAKQAVFFSIFRKIVIVVPLTLLLPHVGFGVDGVFLAEPISNWLGGAACYIAMMIHMRKLLAPQKNSR